MGRRAIVLISRMDGSLPPGGLGAMGGSLALLLFLRLFERLGWGQQRAEVVPRCSDPVGLRILRIALLTEGLHFSDLSYVDPIKKGDASIHINYFDCLDELRYF